ncbi:putative aldolase-type TIM barrel, aldo/keto reductase, aldo-keto reductase [Septoria linicola]|nr:putative aldolase-type TIM barrel, aldo/keto reductase, aldo-keto reductase [Septoria linicola]
MPGLTPTTQKSAVPAGVWCPVVSLYKDTPRQELDLEASYTYFQHLIRTGVNGLVLQGSTAEAALLSPEERIDLTRTARKAATDLGVPRFPIAAGISGQSTNETLRLVDDAAAAAAGADFGLLLPPSYWPKAISNDAIVDFYREVADHARIPIIVYDFPGVTSGVDLGVDMLSRLAPHPNIVGVKLTCANAGKVTSLTAKYAPSEFAVFSGQSDWLLPCLVGGGVGCVTGLGNVFPNLFRGCTPCGKLACKKGLAATKFGTAYFAGPAAGLSNHASFHPRKPYKPAAKALQDSTIETMQHLHELEKSLPDVIAYPVSNGTNGVSKSTLRTHFIISAGTSREASIPAVGFGTWKAGPGEAANAVRSAFEAGYRHFDCAPLYGNEAEIGQIFANAPVPRNEFFVTTKLWSSDHQRVEAALDKSLQDLRLDYVDLFLMHWPVTLSPDTGAEYGKEDRKNHVECWDFTNTWREMEKLLDGGKVRNIGVANFSTVNLEKLLKTARIVPAVNQTELQLLLPQTKLHEYCQAKGIHQTAFGPLGGSGSTLHESPVILDIAKERGIASGNLLLSWGIMKGWSVIPKSTNPARIASNLNSNLALNPDELKQIDELARSAGTRFNKPDWGVTIFHDDDAVESGVA